LRCSVEPYKEGIGETTPNTTEAIMARLTITHGTRTPGLKYRQVALDDIVGKTIQGVGRTTVESASGNEPCVVLLFTDGTRHGFVLPGDGSDE
jgi:hypothetical protein